LQQIVKNASAKGLEIKDSSVDGETANRTCRIL